MVIRRFEMSRQARSDRKSARMFRELRLALNYPPARLHRR